MAPERPVSILTGDPLWYQRAIVYQLHVRSFFDGNGDGIGDFPGLSQKLDYLQDLGVTAIWMLPFYPSPLRDGGYDIADYSGINPEYGTMRDFRTFVQEAHARGLRVITELVINHTSDEHPWFQRARRAPRGSPERDFYVWSDDPRKYAGVRIIFTDFEASNWTWDPVAEQYFWHRFYHHQPDLNFEHPAVHQAVLDALDFWLDTGVDGLRLDAVPYLYEDEGTNCENLPQTHEYLKKLRAHVDDKYPNRMLLAEANMWPEDTRAYFGGGTGDECHMAFNFPVMPRMYMAVQMEDRYPLVDIMNQTPVIPQTAQWALFLRNHDELTLEMVTDEERDYMYRAYADDPRARINLGIRRRLAPLQKSNRSKIELLNGLLMSLPGTPIIYYGDEIGMGDNIYLGDRDGVRTPMQWSADRNAGFSTANPQQLFLPVIIDPDYRYEAINVATQQNNPSSLLLWMRRLIAQRHKHPVFGTGALLMLSPDNPKILAFVRSDDTTTILVVANLSRFPQPAELDLAEHRGLTPVEVFGGNRFPTIADAAYQFTMAPHSFLWLRLEQGSNEERADPGGVPVLTVPSSWSDVFTDRATRDRFSAALPGALAGRSWFNPRHRSVESVRLVQDVEIPIEAAPSARLVLIEVSYTEGEPETYQVPLVHHPMSRATDDPRTRNTLLILHEASGRLIGALADAAAEPAFAEALFDLISRRDCLGFDGGQLAGLLGNAGQAALTAAPEQAMFPAAPSREALRNSAMLLGEQYFLKIFRRVEPGVNPEWELGSHLTDRTDYRNAVRTFGAVELRTGPRMVRTLAVLQDLVVHERDAWDFVVDKYGGYLEDLYRLIDEGRTSQLRPGATLAGFEETGPPDAAHELFGPFLVIAARTGQRLGELHHALGGSQTEPALAAGRFPPHYQRQLYQAARSRVRQSLRALRLARRRLPHDLIYQDVLAAEAELLALLEPVKALQISGLRMRTHGDLHLGQILITGADVVFIDFEGRPTQFISERREKRSPLVDLASLCRSLDIAAGVALVQHLERFNVRQDSADAASLRRGIRFASSWLQATLTQGYLRNMEPDLLSEGRSGNRILMQVFTLDRLGDELNEHLAHAPERVWITLDAMRRLLKEESK